MICALFVGCVGCCVFLLCADRCLLFVSLILICVVVCGVCWLLVCVVCCVLWVCSCLLFVGCCLRCVCCLKCVCYFVDAVCCVVVCWLLNLRVAC